MFCLNVSGVNGVYITIPAKKAAYSEKSSTREFTVSFTDVGQAPLSYKSTILKMEALTRFRASRSEFLFQN